MRALAVAAQIAFTAAWVAATATAGGGYDPLRQPVSELAVPGAAHPWLVTLGLLVWAAGFAALAAMRDRARPLWAAAAVLTAALAFLPLDCAGCAGPHSWHHVAHLAASSVLELVVLATPFVLKRPGVGAAGLVAWLAITLTPEHGLAQRVGFLLISVWVIALTTAPDATPSRRSPRPARPRPAAGR